MIKTSLFANKCTIREPLEIRDRYGQRKYEFSVKSTNVPCRLSGATFLESAAGEIMNDRTRGIVRLGWIVFFPPYVDVREADIITDLVNKDNELLGIELRVTKVVRPLNAYGKINHIEAYCESYKGESQIPA
jgi:hypothetical protein